MECLGLPGPNNNTHRLLAPIWFSIEILSQFDAREIWHNLLSRFSAWPEKTLDSTESRTYFFSDCGRVLVSFPPSYCLARATLTFVYLDQLTATLNMIWRQNPNIRTSVVRSKTKYKHCLFTLEAGKFHKWWNKWDLKALSGPVCCPAASDRNKNYQNWNPSWVSLLHPLQSRKQTKMYFIYVVIFIWKSFIAAWKNLIEQSEFFAI